MSEPTGVRMQELDSLSAEDWSIAAVNRLVHRVEQSSLTAGFGNVRIAVLRSFTIEPLLPFLKAHCYRHRLNPQLFVANYGVIQQEVLAADSGLYRFAPDVIAVLVDNQYLNERLEFGYLPIDQERYASERERTLARYQEIFQGIRAHSRALVLMPNLVYPRLLSLGSYDATYSCSQARLVDEINSGLNHLAGQFRDVHIVDLNYLQSRYGFRNIYDDKLWYTARLPYRADFFSQLMALLVRTIAAARGLQKKCLVLDLDNTLWSGILGEDGFDGIQMGSTYPGNIFADVQRVVLSLYHRGIILAVNSKNNEAEVKRVFQEHPDMLLKEHHFAVTKVNWRNKAENLREISRELNIGLDSLVFIDDDAFTCEMMKDQLPQVETFRVPEDICVYPARLREWTDTFTALSFSEEDRKRGEQYRSRQAVQHLQRAASSPEDFLRSLQMKVEIKRADSFSKSRIAQLTQKTNQFNLTTRRYTEADIEAFMASERHEVYCLRLLDRLGDNGIVQAAILCYENDCAIIDTFLMSCRVIERGIESVFLSWLVTAARRRGVHSARGIYIPSGKNQIAREFYQNHSFTLQQTGSGEEWWHLELARWAYRVPDWYEVTTE